jgi:hypothetical protein
MERVKHQARRHGEKIVRTSTRFIERCSEITDLPALHKEFERSLHTLGFRYFACGAHVDPLHTGPAVMLLNYPDTWVATYSDLKLHRYDPVFERLSRTQMIFAWDDPRFLWSMSGQQRTMFEDARQFGIEHGYTMPVYSAELRIPILASCSVIPDRRFVPSFELSIVQVMAQSLFNRAVQIVNMPHDQGHAPGGDEEQRSSPGTRREADHALEVVQNYIELSHRGVPWLDRNAALTAFSSLPKKQAVALGRALKTQNPALLQVRPIDALFSSHWVPSPLRLSALEAQIEIEHIIEQVLKITDVERRELYSASQRHDPSLARAMIAWQVTTRQLITLRGIANQLGRSSATLSLGIQRYSRKHPTLFRLTALNDRHPFTDARIAGKSSNATEE